MAKFLSHTEVRQLALFVDRNKDKEWTWDEWKAKAVEIIGPRMADSALTATLDEVGVRCVGGVPVQSMKDLKDSRITKLARIMQFIVTELEVPLSTTDAKTLKSIAGRG